MNNNQNWQEQYRDLVTSPSEAVGEIQPGQRIFVGTGCGQPDLLVDALTERAKELRDTEIVHLLTCGSAPYAKPELAEYFRVNSFFVADNVRSVIQEGLGDYTPVFISEIPRLFSSGQMPLDVALIQVSPPDERGLCSLGVSVDIVKSAAENAALVIAEVNPRMPHTHGDSCINVFDIDILVPVDKPVIEMPSVPVDPTIKKIAEHIAALIDDGSTIELGIGRIPQAVAECLKDKHDLGVHTEMFTDSVLDLLESGAVTGARKSLDRGKVVASFCLGTQRLYDYIDQNPLFAFHPSEYVSDPQIISRQANMVAVNVGLEVDLTGQVCADSLGDKFYSGIGGQVDFNRGAAQSQGGKAIIALPSTANNGKISRIACHLSSGAGVTLTRGDVHYVVTEFGSAYLHGKSVQERAIALISISHPDFREQLLEDAIKAKFVHPELADVEGKMSITPPDLKTSFSLEDGTLFNVRLILPTDAPRMRNLLYSMSQETVNYRFLSRAKEISQKVIRNAVYVDYRSELAIVATLPNPGGEEIIAVGRYYLDPATNRAEVAFVVQDHWQGRGIGTFMLDYLTSIAKRNGISGFTAEVLPDNKAMQSILAKCACKVASELKGDTYSYRLDFEQPR